MFRKSGKRVQLLTLLRDLSVLGDGRDGQGHVRWNTGTGIIITYWYNCASSSKLRFCPSKLPAGFRCLGKTQPWLRSQVYFRGFEFGGQLAIAAAQKLDMMGVVVISAIIALDPRTNVPIQVD